MRLQPGGIDIFYIDESHDDQLFVVTAIAVPFLRNVDGIWTITWGSHLDAAKEWRRGIYRTHKIPAAKELHGVKLASGRGQYFHGKWRFDRPKAGAVYRDILSRIDFIPDGSVLSAATIAGRNLYGSARLEAALHALFQRMRKQCAARSVNALVFFDEGHPEYRSYYRRAQTFLPTGSMRGGWGPGAASKNLPLDMFTKDANIKQSCACFFTQAADLVAYSAFLKIKSEQGQLTDWQNANNLENLYDHLPIAKINIRATNAQPRDGIVRII